jgi:hypothetical protein
MPNRLKARLAQPVPIITVVGKEVNVNGEIIAQGVVPRPEGLRPWSTTAIRLRLKPWLLETKCLALRQPESIEGFRSIWGAANMENRATCRTTHWMRWQCAADTIAPGARHDKPRPRVPVCNCVGRADARQFWPKCNFGIPRQKRKAGSVFQRLQSPGRDCRLRFPDSLARAGLRGTKVLDYSPKLYDTKRIVHVHRP